MSKDKLLYSVTSILCIIIIICPTYSQFSNCNTNNTLKGCLNCSANNFLSLNSTSGKMTCTTF